MYTKKNHRQSTDWKQPNEISTAANNALQPYNKSPTTKTWLKNCEPKGNGRHGRWKKRVDVGGM